MVGPGERTVKAGAVLIVAGALVAGCFWREYGPLMATHVDVLVGIARKGVDLVASGRFTAESLPELTYPLERAQAFAARARDRAGGAPPPSLDAFDALIVRYRTLVEAIDRERRDATGGDARAALAAPLAAVEDGAERVRGALREEHRLR